MSFIKTSFKTHGIYQSSHLFAAQKYETATALVVTFVLKDTAEAQTWQDEFVSFMATYTNDNMVIRSTPAAAVRF